MGTMKPFAITCLLAFAMSSGASAAWQHGGGLDGVRVNALSANATHLFAGTRDSGVMRSGDNGTTWQPVNSGLTDRDIRSLQTKGAYVFAGGRDSGVFRSGDNGAGWTAVNTGISSTNIQALGVKDSFLFAGTAGGGVCRSSDNGAQWIEVNKLDDGTDLHFKNIFSFGVSRLYIFIGTWGGSAFRSADNGTTWYLITNGLFDPRENIIPYAFATNDTFVFAGTDRGGVFRARDSAGVWFPVNTGLPDSAVVRAMAMNGKNLYAATQRGVYRSADSGGSWVADNSGMTDTLVHALIVVGTDLYAGTNNGIWKLPLADQTVDAGHIARAMSTADGIRLTISGRSAVKTIGYETGDFKNGVVSLYAPSGKQLFAKRVSGSGAISWNAQNRAGGVYLARLQTGSVRSAVMVIVP